MSIVRSILHRVVPDPIQLGMTSGTRQTGTNLTLAIAIFEIKRLFSIFVFLLITDNYGKRYEKLCQHLTSEKCCLNVSDLPKL